MGDVMRAFMARTVLFQEAVARAAALNPTDLQCANLLLLHGPATPGELAERAGLTADQLYFNIEQVGNTSSASIPLAIHDAVRDGVITEPLRVFAPGFGAGAVAGYAVMRVDPAVVAVQTQSVPHEHAAELPAPAPAGESSESASEGMRQAFG